MTPQPHEDLNWLAQRYVLDELDAEAHEAFEARLAVDEEAAAAMASAVQVLAALQSSPAPRIEPAPKNDAVLAGWGLAVGILATAAALSAVWLIPSSRDGVGMPNEAADLVAMWTETSPDGVAAMESDHNDEPGGSDEIPDWLLAAVTLEAAASTGNHVLEN